MGVVVWGVGGYVVVGYCVVGYCVVGMGIDGGSDWWWMGYVYWYCYYWCIGMGLLLVVY